MTYYTDEQIEKMFWVDKPEQWGWRGLSLLITSIVTAIGLFAFAVMAFSFTELNELPYAFRRALVLVGAFSLAAGGEIGTVFTVIEVYRKPGRNGWDWSALVVSCLATFGAFLLAFAALLRVSVRWSDTVRAYGPILQGVLVALDGYGLFVELGLYLASYDTRMRHWRQEFTQFKRKVKRDAYEARLEAHKARETPTDSAPHVTQGAHKARYATKKAHVLALLSNGGADKTHEEIASIVGCSRGYVSNVAKKAQEDA